MIWVLPPRPMENRVNTLYLISESLGNIWGAHIGEAVQIATCAKVLRQRFFFIGNGGSAAIASHMAADWLKNGRVRAQCFNDAAQITALTNDDGYESVFVRPLLMHAIEDDVLFAISSSGKSENIVVATKRAKEMGMKIITLSGFDQRNPLRDLGHVNFYVPSDRYGVVEVCHHAICHAILDEVIEASK